MSATTTRPSHGAASGPKPALGPTKVTVTSARTTTASVADCVHGRHAAVRVQARRQVGGDHRRPAVVAGRVDRDDGLRRFGTRRALLQVVAAAQHRVDDQIGPNQIARPTQRRGFQTQRRQRIAIDSGVAPGSVRRPHPPHARAKPAAQEVPGRRVAVAAVVAAPAHQVHRRVRGLNHLLAHDPVFHDTREVEGRVLHQHHRRQAKGRDRPCINADGLAHGSAPESHPWAQLMPSTLAFRRGTATEPVVASQGFIRIQKSFRAPRPSGLATRREGTRPEGRGTRCANELRDKIENPYFLARSDNFQSEGVYPTLRFQLTRPPTSHRLPPRCFFVTATRQNSVRF